MNKALLIGRNTKDIELKATTSGKSVVTFNIAVNRPYKNDSGERDCDFLNCIAFSKLAETISKYVKKGDLIGVEGRIQTRSYTDKWGNNRYSTEIMVENIEFLQSKKEKPQEEVKMEELDPFADLPF